MMSVIKLIKPRLETLVINPGKVNKGVPSECGRPEQGEEKSRMKPVPPGK